jgi:hypothetical protein
MTCEECRQALPQVITNFGEVERSKAPEEPPPAEVGGHKIERELGRGGMGRVYLAREPVLGRNVALKVLNSGLRTPQGAERMLEEAVVTGTLSHPGIVPVYHVGRDPAQGLFYTMKLVGGRSLSDILTGLRDDAPEDVERYTLPALLAIFLRACEAVAFAHHHGIVHRDLKPANIMVGEFGEVMVLDWGLARVVDDRGERQRPAVPAAGELGVEVAVDSGLSRSGAVLGSAGYMSPEQARGQAATAGPRSDVYALGAVLYQILTLRMPVDGRADEQISRTIRGAVVPVEKRPLGRNAPRVLAAAAMKALALDPAKRFRDARELAREVEAYLEGRAPWSPRAEKWESALGKWKMGAAEMLAEKAPARALHESKLSGDVRLNVTVRAPAARPSWKLDVHVAQKAPPAADGYLCRVVAGEDGAVEFHRAGILLSRRRDLAPDAHRPHTVTVTKDGDRVSIGMDGIRVFDMRDIFPLRGQRLSIATDDAGLNLTHISVESRGTPLQLQFSALPDKLLSMGQLREARELYRDMMETHAERAEGLIARYKAALCSIELGESAEGLAELKALEGTGHEALVALGKSRAALRSRIFKEAWAVLTEACDKFRNDPLRVELWSNVVHAVDRVETQNAANARTLYLNLLKLPWLAPHEVMHVVASLLRLASAAGGEAQAKAEALAHLAAHPTQLGARMELHAFLSRAALGKDALAVHRAAIQKTLDLKEQVTRPDRARLLIWLIETCLGEADVAGAEKWLTNAVSSLSHPSVGGLWARNWRALLSAAQGRWADAEKGLAPHTETYAGGDSALHLLGALLESLAAAGGTDAAKLRAALESRAEGKGSWASLVPALTGAKPPDAFTDWVPGQPREARCALLLAGSVALAAIGNGAGSEGLAERATREAVGAAFAEWFAERRGVKVASARRK